MNTAVHPSASAMTPSPPVVTPRKNAKFWKADTPDAISRNEILRRQNASDGPSGNEGRDPPKSHRDQDAQHRVAGAAAVHAALRPSGRRVPSACSHLEQLYRARNIRKWTTFYNHQRPHSALSGKPTVLANWQGNDINRPEQQVQRVPKFRQILSNGWGVAHPR